MKQQKMAIGYIKCGIVCLDKMSKSAKLEAAIDKELEVDNEFDDPIYELFQELLLDPLCISPKGLTTARIKSHLKKRRHIILKGKHIIFCT